MAYTLKLTNGKILLTLPDQQFDSITTSLTLIGKNVNAYGTDINQNYIRILENFSNTSAPRAPLVGQVWYDYAEQRLKVYTNNLEWKPIGGPTIASSQPLTLVPGDLWFDSTSQQLKFSNTNGEIITIGPASNAAVGKSGWLLEPFNDTISASTITVLTLYDNNEVIAFLSDKTAGFNFERVLSNNTGSGGPITETVNQSISPGLTLVNRRFDGLYPTFTGTATAAKKLITDSGVELGPEDFLVDTGPGTTLKLRSGIEVEGSAVFGSNQDFQFSHSSNMFGRETAKLIINGQGGGGGADPVDFQLLFNPLSGSKTFFYSDGSNGTLGMFTDQPVSTFTVPGESTSTSVDLDVRGNILVRGDLIVTGATTTISAQDLVVQDKTITIGATASPITDESLVDDGGIILKGSLAEGDKTIKWKKQLNTWEFNTHLHVKWASTLTNLTSGTIYIDDKVLAIGIRTTSSQVVNSTNYIELGEDVKSAPFLEKVGHITSATVGALRLGYRVDTSTNPPVVYGTIEPARYDRYDEAPVIPQVIELGAGPTTSHISSGGKKVYNVATPEVTDPGHTAATKEYVDDAISISRNLKAITTIDVSGIAENPEDPNLDDFVILMLTYLLPPDAPPPYDTPENSLARIMVVRYLTPEILDVPSNYMDPGLPLYVDKGGVQETAQTIAWSQYLRVTTNLPPYPLGVNRAIKQYVCAGGVWNRYISTGTSNTLWSDGTW